VKRQLDTKQNKTENSTDEPISLTGREM